MDELGNVGSISLNDAYNLINMTEGCCSLFGEIIDRLKSILKLAIEDHEFKKEQGKYNGNIFNTVLGRTEVHIDSFRTLLNDLKYNYKNIGRISYDDDFENFDDDFDNTDKKRVSKKTNVIKN